MHRAGCNNNIIAVGDLRPVDLSYQRSDGSRLTGTVWVMPDYLAIGKDDDFLRMPLSLPDALTICDEYGFVLPTRKIVDAVYQQASLHLAPKPMTPGPQKSDGITVV